MVARDDETVKGLSWKLLYGNYRRTVGPETWDRMVAEVGGPDVVKMDQMEDVPMEPLNRMVRELDRLVGRGSGTEIDHIAKKSVEGWANFNKNLVKQLQGEPHKMMEVFATEVHPFFLNDLGASALAATVPATKKHDGGVEMDLPNGLDVGFKVGLLRGFVELTGAKPEVVQKSGSRYLVTWNLPQKRRGSKGALLANTVRAPFLTATIVPVLVGWALAWWLGHFDPALPLHWGYLSLTLVAAAFFHMGTNAANDYYDHKSGADEANYTPTPFSGGSRVIQRGLRSAGSVRNVAALCFAIGTILGVGLMLWTGIYWLAAFGVVGALVGWTYTAPPLKLVHRGLGELAVAFGFGPLIVVGTWTVFAGWDPASWSAPLLASVPVALMVAAILYINEFPDRRGDAAVGKRTLVVRLSPPVAMTLFALLLVGAYAALVAGALNGLLPMWAMLGLLTVPGAVFVMRKLVQDHDHAYKLIPANAMTILVLHLGTGILMTVGLVIGALTT